MEKKSAAITGAGSGLGREIALGLAAKGYKVFGTAFSPSEVSGLASAAPAGDITLTICDIIKEEDVKNWARVVTSALNDTGLDLLINNAGVLTLGHCPRQCQGSGTPDHCR
jgi:NAD(P)-dependent dehydrogenase (short-subunit alcohol dehydrogenase family)